MNIVLLRQEDWTADGHARLDGRRAKHIREVIKVGVGDRIRVGQIGGQCGEGVVMDLTDSGVALSVSLDQAPPPRHPYTIVLALPRPKMLRRVLRTCAEFGVTELHIIHSYRVEKSYWQSPLLSPEKIDEALVAGLERSGDTLLPTVRLHKRFRPFVEDTLPSVANSKPIYIAHPGPFRSFNADGGEPAVAMIGPEGGFIPFELELAQSQGAEPRRLGQRVLSVDTALNAVLARELGG